MFRPKAIFFQNLVLFRTQVENLDFKMTSLGATEESLSISRRPWYKNLKKVSSKLSTPKYQKSSVQTSCFFTVFFFFIWFVCNFSLKYRWIGNILKFHNSILDPNLRISIFDGNFWYEPFISAPTYNWHLFPNLSGTFR